MKINEIDGNQNAACADCKKKYKSPIHKYRMITFKSKTIADGVIFAIANWCSVFGLFQLLISNKARIASPAASAVDCLGDY